MQKLVSIALFLCTTNAIKAQQFYFAYLQTENKQAFYVKINDKLLSSSNSGYVVIPKLNTGTYPLTVGFAKDKWPQQKFTLTINNTDDGYLLKNFGEKGWGLYNLQSLQITMNGEATPQISNTEEDAFAAKLSGATNANNIAVNKNQTVKTKNTNAIQKIADVNNNFGRFLKYSITSSNQIDTVDVNINYADELIVAEKDVISIPTPTNTIKEQPKEEKFLNINVTPTIKNIEATEQPKTNPEPPTTNNTKPFTPNDKPIVNFNSDCKTIASEDDFYKTRKKIAMENNDDDMVEVAKKLFKQKCYTVAQVKNLSLIFISDLGKYQLFDAAYPFTTDTQNFPTLQAQLTDTYYINRFKAMLKN